MRRELATSVLVMAVALAACGGGQTATGGPDNDPKDDPGDHRDEDRDKDPKKEPDLPAKPVRNCEDVLAVVRTHAPHYDTQRQTMQPDDVTFQCDITYTESPVLDDAGNYTEVGVLDDILVTVATGADERPEECPPEGYCVDTETQHVPEQPGIPAVDVIHTTVSTAHVLLSMSEETHGPQTPTDQTVQLTLEIEAGRAGP